jgi:hypothetical protein
MEHVDDVVVVVHLISLLMQCVLIQSCLLQQISLLGLGPTRNVVDELAQKERETSAKITTPHSVCFYILCRRMPQQVAKTWLTLPADSADSDAKPVDGGEGVSGQDEECTLVSP